MPRPRKSAGPSLDLDRVVAAALSLIDAEGLDALSMRRLGQALGVEAPSIYRLAPSKAALLDAVCDAVAQELDPIPDAAGWADHLRRLAEGWRRLLLRHPNLLPLFYARSPAAPRWRAEAERAEAALRAAGFSGSQANYLYKTLTALVVSHAASEASPPRGAPELPEEQATAQRSPEAPEGAERADAWFEFALALLLQGAAGLKPC